MRHRGYNITNSPLGNATAKKFGYNGIELEEGLGIDWMEMGARKYDASIGRWNGIDPVTHFNLSTYNAFDNNPVYWADPSGANARKGSLTDWSAMNSMIEKHHAEAKKEKKKKETEPVSVVRVTRGEDGKYHGKLLMRGKGKGKHTTQYEVVDSEGMVKAIYNGDDAYKDMVSAGIVLSTRDYGRSTVEAIIDATVQFWTSDDYRIKKGRETFVNYIIEVGTAGGLGMYSSLKYADDVYRALNAAKTSTQAFKSFTKSNYRHNLQVLTGKSGVGMDAHHIFPQAERFQAQWSRVGINIHNPKNMSWWKSGPHRSAPHGYNKAWDSFFKQSPNATRQQIESFGSSLMKSHGF